MKLVLPVPPSVNQLFATDWKTKMRFKTKAYERWLREAEDVLRTTKWTQTKGPVRIVITIPDAGGKDLANHEKALVDFLVKHQIIENDSRQFVRRIEMEWGAVKGAVVEVFTHEMGR